MKLTLRKSVLALGCLTLLAACEAKIESDATPAPPDRFSGKARVDGPNLEGSWQTACLSNGGYSSSRLTMTFAGKAFTRKVDNYTDQYCQTVKDTETRDGEFIFTSKYKDDSYNINYAIDEKNGWTAYTEEKVLLENGLLYTSRFLIGEDAPLFKQAPLKRNGWVATECEAYTGNYENQYEKLKIEQKACELITVAGNSYLPDGFERYYKNGLIKAGFLNKLFRREYRNQYQENILEQWSFQNRPCNIVNPTKDTFLTKEVWINGSYSYSNCSYYNRAK